MRINIEDSELTRFTNSAKQEYESHVKQYANDLVDGLCRLSDNFEELGSDVTPTTVKNANTSVRRYNIRKKDKWYIFQVNASVVLSLIAGAAIGKVIGDIDKALSENVLITILAIISTLLFLFLSNEVKRRA